MHNDDSFNTALYHQKANWEPSEAMLEKVKGVRRTYNKHHMLSIGRFISMSHYQPTNPNISELQSHYLLIFRLRGLIITSCIVSRL